MPEVQQHGGDHYQAEYQHWDFVIDTQMGYLPGCATKYVSRWWKKNGLDDLIKARTYIEKMIKNVAGILPGEETPDTVAAFNRFVVSNNLPGIESAFVYRVMTWQTPYHLHCAMDSLDMLITIAKGGAAPAQGSATGQAAGMAAPTLAGHGHNAPTGQPHSATQGATGQGAAAKATTAPEVSKSRGLIGLEHPFGYEDGA
jgi:hypothetical protein